MRKLRYLWLASAVVAMAASCTLNRLEEPSASGREGTQVTLTAFTAGSGADTKAMLVDGAPEIYWAPNEQIMVFRRDWGMTSFQATNVEPATVVEFTGYVTTVAGAVSKKDRIWAFYPKPDSWSDIKFDYDTGLSVKVELPYAQTAAAGTFDPKALLMSANSASTDLAFYHVGGGLKFKLTQDWIQQVEFRTNDGTPLAGWLTFEWDEEDHPVITKVEEGADAIVLTAPYGETFKPDTWYYLCCAPAVLEQGYTLIFRSEHKTGVGVHAGPAEVKRATWSVLESADAGVVPEDAENIIFNEIRYTTTDGKVLMPETNYGLWSGGVSTPSYKPLFGAEIISSTYEDGVGRILFDGPVTMVSGIAFNGGENSERLKSISLPTTVRTIGASVFSGCSSLENVGLPAGLTTIGFSAFSWCSSLNVITLPENLLTIGDRAFCYTPISQIAIPGGVQTVGEDIFEGCNNLTAILGPLATADKRGLVLDGTLAAFARGGINDYPYDYVLEEGITGLADGVFESFWQLRELTLPQSLETIGERAFAYCSKLEAFNGKFASEDHHLLVCDGQIVGTALNGVTSLTVPGTVRSIAPYAFSYKNTLITLVLSEGVEEIGNNAFESCGNLREVTLPQSLASIGDRVFLYCNNLEAFHGKYAAGEGKFLVVEGALKAVAFRDLTVVNVPEGVTSLGPSVFQNAGITSVTLPAGLTAIGERAFMYCRDLTGITLPESLQTIGDEAFYSCDNDAFTTFTIPSGVTAVGKNIISYCTKLTSVTVLPTTPPSAPNNYQPLGWNFNNAPIYVPTASLEAYQNADGWRYQSNYQAITE